MFLLYLEIITNCNDRLKHFIHTYTRCITQTALLEQSVLFLTKLQTQLQLMRLLLRV